MTRPGNTPRRTILQSVTDGDPIPHRCTYSADLGETGIVRVHCADLVLIGHEAREGRPVSVSIIVGQQGCACGCKMPGRVFEHMPTPDEARAFAHQLVEAADAVDAQATTDAAALLDRVRSDRRA